MQITTKKSYVITSPLFIFLIIIMVASIGILLWVMGRSSAPILHTSPQPNVSPRFNKAVGTIQSIDQNSIAVRTHTQIQVFTINSFTQSVRIITLSSADLRDGMQVILGKKNQRNTLRVVTEGHQNPQPPNNKKQQTDTTVFGTLHDCTSSQCTLISPQEESQVIDLHTLSIITKIQKIPLQNLTIGSQVQVGYTENGSVFKAMRIEVFD